MKTQIKYRTNDLRIQEEVEQFITEWNSGKTVFEVKTSGSTGNPKNIQLTREQLSASAKRTLDFFKLEPGNTALLGLSPATIGGKMMIVRALIGNLTLIVTEPSGFPTQALLAGEELDFCPMVPVQLKQLLEYVPAVFEQIKTILIGGSPLSSDLEKALQKVHQRCFVGFGMTETVSHIAIRKLGTYYYSALEGVSLNAENEQLIITDSLLGIEHLKTTDTIRLIDSQTFEWLGRADFAINSGGIKLHPELIEKELSTIISGPFFIAGERDDTFGEICIIIFDYSTLYPELEFIQNFCKEHIGPYAFPKKAYRSAIVFNSGGKIDRLKTLQQLGIK
ncbi:MAG: AMP-binding protein [Fluviicola sp.]|nr:AMP-binding protein [Fluviicola sp.]